MSVDLSFSTSPEECRERMKLYLSQHPEITKGSKIWLLGRGWDQTRWNNSVFPTANDLDSDAELRDIPISMERVDVHAIWANGLAMQLATKYFPADYKVDGGEIVMNEMGKPSGIFIDNAMSLICMLYNSMHV
jgi:predicted amidohydrolase YtcJ